MDFYAVLDHVLVLLRRRGPGDLSRPEASSSTWMTSTSKPSRKSCI